MNKIIFTLYFLFKIVYKALSFFFISHFSFLHTKIIINYHTIQVFNLKT
jgi:hypothetical protein